MAIPFTTFHKKWCAEKTQLMIQNNFSQWFRDPPHNSIRNYDQYLAVVKYPISLSEIADRIRLNIYQYVFEWDNDMQAVFKNAMAFNSKNSQPYFIAQYLLDSYIKECTPIPASQQEDNMILINRQAQKLLNLLESPPPSIKNLKWDIPPLSNDGTLEWKDLKMKNSELSQPVKEALEKLSALIQKPSTEPSK
ncbi:Bromodomain containing protein [Trichomonas vaginalis G3]|uniref:Bromodomain containing protein n=1 Tax=Trichomonas vaginalis (strain ATCC PRA-98 / G3) TaxID=412133 RepID=A2FGR4_TRIV3|nr:bromodomain family [Trichomonas vaginalis G3]EAX95900.1 Bromodomain containing protein [Trichomonas vaginalis G3]KAI5551224.1 bromodomain family [Trichomonas vaginalis G3]|eukprot:XP_001308830.1 Bromodomain containing protein [Trichomonas vaginalis G3]